MRRATGLRRCVLSWKPVACAASILQGRFGRGFSPQGTDGRI